MAHDVKTIEVLLEALDDEYRARAAYQKVIDTFGPVRPFVNIVEAEDRHAQALLALLAHFGVEPPPDKWAGQVPAPPSLLAACQAGVEAEIENEAMYQRLLRQTEHPEVLAVMRRLQQASQERHLPAFRRCLERMGGADATLPPTVPGGGAQRRAQVRRRGA